MKWRPLSAVLAVLAAIVVGSPRSDGRNNGPVVQAAAEVDLAFDGSRYADRTLTLGDRTIAFRAFENIVYVSRPVEARYQSLNFYVPAAYFEGAAVGGHTAETAPIFLPNTVGGYMPGLPGGPGQDRSGRPNAVLVALSRGSVVAVPGARGRTLQDPRGAFTGKAPACIMDLKAAVRYLRFNDKVMPGDAEKIVTNGTSAGGALSGLLGATGGSADYEPYLEALGAADAHDGVFAASCYCPITDLDNADAAHEWLFHGVDDYEGRMGKGRMTAAQIGVSGRLKALFPDRVNGLGLKKDDGAALTLDADGNGPFKDLVKSFLAASAQTALDGGADLPAAAGFTVKDGAVAAVDLARFAAWAGRMKTAPAFDALDLGSPENSLFGSAMVDKRHFTAFARDRSADRTMAEAAVVKMMNPIPYIGAPGTVTARHWRIRHGAIDKDTSLAVPVILATKLRNEGFDVDFAAAWAARP